VDMSALEPHQFETAVLQLQVDHFERTAKSDVDFV
jgi:hypothetical protein